MERVLFVLLISFAVLVIVVQVKPSISYLIGETLKFIFAKVNSTAWNNKMKNSIKRKKFLSNCIKKSKWNNSSIYIDNMRKIKKKDPCFYLQESFVVIYLN